MDHDRFAVTRAFLMRHRLKILDGGVLLILTLLALFYALEIDVFITPGQTAKQEGLELDEVMAVSALFCGGLVIFALRRMREQRRETARRIAAEREARTLALTDALTGLPNRRRFDEALKAACAQPPRAGGSHAVLMMDLNGFKRVNDVFGHGVGDELLIQVGARLGKAIREGDTLARLGGDEFVVLAPHIAGAEAATGLALRIIDTLRTEIAAGGGHHHVGVAVGLSLTPQDGADPAELLRKADIALYRAKERKLSEGSALNFFEPEMDAHVRERDRVEQELRLAIERDEVTPFFQPLIGLEGGAVTAFEPLARWTSPTLGAVEPERFITIAEDAGLIGPLTDRLLERACTAASAWPPTITLAFNVSGALLQDKGFGLRVMSILGRTGLLPQRLELEITESALVRDLDAAREILGALREAGVKIALDDFGTGYSSLYHLRNFKLDKIKIDRSFVETMAADSDSAAIVKALVGLGTGLGLKVTAEGVETDEQERLLRAEGCDEAQGFRYSEAVDAAEALRMIGGGSTAIAAPGRTAAA